MARTPSRGESGSRNPRGDDRQPGNSSIDVLDLLHRLIKGGLECQVAWTPPPR